LRRKCNIASIPPLRDGTNWILDAKAKADTFAGTFVSKSKLAPELVDTPFFGTPNVEMCQFLPFRSRIARRLFKNLDTSKATGPDRISAAILKRLYKVLAVPFTRVCRRLFNSGCWPNTWRTHLIVPIFKRGSAFQPGNYRGVHLTSVLSKIAEKVIGNPLVPYLQATAFGPNQWGFSTGVGAKDLVTMLVMSWTLAVCSDRKVGAYLSDISGAFDRVSKTYLLSKLYAAGVGPMYLNF